MRLQSANLDYYANTYRFSFEKGVAKDLSESFKKASGSFSNLKELNERLSKLEKKGEQAAYLINIEDQPKDIMELFKKVAGGKYFTFLQNNVDGIMVGRNLEEKVDGTNFMESLGFSLEGSSAKELFEGKLTKVIGIDTYNSIFQNVETETEADKQFTEYTQTVSVFMNELKQAYFISKGDSSESQELYDFMMGAIEDIETYLDSGNNFSFVPGSQVALFKESISMMKDSISSHIKETYGSTAFSFQWTA